MLRPMLTVALTASLLIAAQTQAADVYKYTDEHGNVLYTDKPATLPAERLNVQSKRTDVVALQARQLEEQQRMQTANQARQQGAAQQADQRNADAVSATAKAEQCTKARERYDTYMNSQRLYEQQDDGERRYLTDEQLDAARNAARASMDALCK